MYLKLKFLINFFQESSFLLPTCSYSITGLKRVLQSTIVTILVRVLRFWAQLRWVLRVILALTFPFSSIASIIYTVFPICANWYNVFLQMCFFPHIISGVPLPFLILAMVFGDLCTHLESWSGSTYQPCQFSLAWKIHTIFFYISWSPVKIKTWTRIPDKTWTKKKQS